MGILFEDWFESFFSKPKLVGGMLLITGLVLWITRFAKKEGKPLEQIGWFDAILIGIAQGAAIIPGISRSGATISTGLFCGLDRELSGKFSFLLSIPAILGATLLEFRKIDMASGLGTVLIGTAVAFGVGILALTFLMKIIKMGRIFNFSYYCCGMGILMIILL
jgi:undecaprenyl-diphosphatase